MKMQNIAVVGGGVTGMVASALLATKGHQVELYESSNQLGGVLRDITFNEDWYFRGCQYLAENPWWHSQLELPMKLRTFPDTYSSYTNLGAGEPILLSDFAQPVFSGKHVLPKLKETPVGTMEYLTGFGDVSKSLIQWADSFNVRDDLHFTNLSPMQLDRVYFSSMHDDVSALKSQSAVFDKCLGIPRGRREQKPLAAIASIPSNGFDRWLSEFEENITSLGVNIHCSSPVTPFRSKAERIKFRVRSNEIRHDAVVWCGNPTALIYTLSGYRLQADPVLTTSVYGELFELEERDPTYWQIFDTSKHLFRLFVWCQDSRLKFTAEAARAPVKKIHNDISSFLKIVLPNAKVKFVGHEDEQRWINTTVSDYQEITGLRQQMLDQNIIPGGWEVFAREQKLAQLSATFAEVGYL